MMDCGRYVLKVHYEFKSRMTSNRLDLISITVVIIAKSILKNTSLGVRRVRLDRGR
jgi:hypothetical protein